MSDSASVYYGTKKAATLWKSGGKYYLQYDKSYLDDPDAVPISFRLQLTAQRFEADKLFPFFENLISEGWLLQSQSQTQKIDESDYFRLLLENGRDLIGAVSVIPNPGPQ